MLQGFFQIAVTLFILVAIASFFGRYMARVYLGEKTRNIWIYGLGGVIAPFIAIKLIGVFVKTLCLI